MAFNSTPARRARTSPPTGQRPDLVGRKDPRCCRPCHETKRCFGDRDSGDLWPPNHVFQDGGFQKHGTESYDFGPDFLDVFQDVCLSNNWRSVFTKQPYKTLVAN